MIELIKYIVNSFAEDKENLKFETVEKPGAVDVTITVAESDMGKVIGRQGKLAKALRTIVKAGSAKENVRYNIEIKSNQE